MTPKSHRVRANGLDHHVLEWAGGGATCVLIHGYMDAAGTWDLVAPTLAENGLRVIAPDMRGFGDGARVPPGGYYHFPDYVADLAGILAEVAPDGPLFVVGHSMGGTITTLFSGAFPARPSKIALLEGLGPPDMRADDAPDRMARWIDEVRNLSARPPRATFPRDEALRRLAMNHPNVPADVLATRLAHLVKDAGDGNVAWRFDPLHKTTSPVPFFSAVYRAFAGRVACPALFVSGGAAGWHPADEDARLGAFPRLRRETLDDAGHMMHWTRPLPLARLLLQFWAETA